MLGAVLGALLFGPCVQQMHWPGPAALRACGCPVCGLYLLEVRPQRFP